jgi:uncharacterized protein (DUF433 family)
MVDIVRSDDVMGGEPRIEGRRISVLQVADMVLDGAHSPEHVADQLDISLSEVHTALAHYYEHPEEMEAIRERHEDLETTLAERAATPDHVEQ